MAKYAISGVWKDENEVITHYSFHEVNMVTRRFGMQSKISKAQAIRLLETAGNSAFTMTWNYSKASWEEDEGVSVVGTGTGKYLRSNPDKSLTDNLSHLMKWNDVIS